MSGRAPGRSPGSSWRRTIARAPSASRSSCSELFRHLYDERVRLGLAYLVAAMEGASRGSSGALGFLFQPLGAPINYFGEVVPYGATLASMQAGYENILDYERTCLMGSAPRTATSA